jgi:hypothetical protein
MGLDFQPHAEGPHHRRCVIQFMYRLFFPVFEKRPNARRFGYAG